jgi:hypothetical protein
VPLQPPEEAVTSVPWQPPPDGVPLEQGPWIVPQDFYDKLMSYPPGADVSHLFVFEPGWDLTVTRTGEEPWETTNSSTSNSQAEDPS